MSTAAGGPIPLRCGAASVASAARYLSAVEGGSQAGELAALRIPPDIILSGTPSGVAMGRKPDPEPYLLGVGNVLESEIEGIGTMRHAVAAEPNKERSWDWDPALGENA